MICSLQIGSCLALACLLLVAGSADAVFSMPTDVIDSGGGMRSSANYRVLDAVGQQVQGRGISTGHVAETGFIGTLIGTGHLLPGIGVTPPALSFTTVVGVNPAAQPLSIANTGGSTLAWSLSGGPRLTFSPFFGSGNGVSQVGINGAGLSAGTYGDSISVAGEGADNTPVSVPVSLTVKVGYTLSVGISGSGGGSVTVTPPGTACNTNCGIDVPPPGAMAAVHAAPDQYSLLTSMSGACTGSGDCSTVMSADKSEAVVFARDTAHMARVLEQTIPGNPAAGYYVSLQNAYRGAISGQTIQAWGVEFTENFVSNAVPGKAVTIKGGYTGSYGSNSGGLTVMRGTLTVATGAVTVENLLVR